MGLQEEREEVENNREFLICSIKIAKEKILDWNLKGK